MRSYSALWRNLFAPPLLCLLGVSLTTVSLAATAKRTDIAPGVSFVPPTGFTELSNDELAQKYARTGGSPPQTAFGDAKRNASIAVTVTHSTSQSFTDASLPTLRPQLEQNINQIRGAKWLQRTYITLTNQRWIQLEFLVPGVDTTIYNDMYVTAYKGDLVIFNFNMPEHLRKQYTNAMRISRDSIRLAR